MSNALHVTAPQGQPSLAFVREVDAPVAAVFAAHRDPDLLARWLGPHGYEMVVTEYDFRSGGRWRYVHRNPAGDEFGFHGCFHTVRDDELAVQTFEFEVAPDHVSLDTVRFEPLEGGRTRLRGSSVFQSVEARDAMVASGMERGMREGYERLDVVLTAPGA
ncbi:SRPBCC family protein [Lapillicoccus jejuensis]|uniref:Uncharacterized protein YndB with AHSA1/START domain n=1 Tax=Lapillicoccus jejuensis TaxID=402171 RepID=A0A542E4W0_9MICO|nr:SRPBCC family protein [Lapillicoccus jejuensis]TQJ10304.1 uncharacterized protein YndB with AHSA1/START domain [Lapillicoccus jejuensis]